MRELGQHDEALAAFRQAAALSPHFASARANLGRTLLELGRPAEALPHCREAVRLCPGEAVLHYQLGLALRAVGQPGEARDAFLEAVRRDARYARAYAELGTLLRQEGRFRQALACFREAARLEDGNAALWQLAGELHWDLGEFEPATTCWQRVLALDPQRAEGHLGLACGLQERGCLDEAREHYRIALRLQPNLARAQVGLGHLHEMMGERVEAEAAYRDALRLVPNDALALACLAKLLGGKLPEADRAAVEQCLADPSLVPEIRAHLLFGLAHVLDAREDFAGAAETSRRANAAMSAARRGRREYDSAAHAAFVANVLRVFGKDFFARVAGMGLPTERPVFVFGLPRSGTTLIEQVLASHSRVHGAGELLASVETFERLPAVLGRAGPPVDCVRRLDAASIRRLGGEYLERLKAPEGVGAERLIDKMPENYLYLGYLAALFPRATFIHCRRDLRDTAVSCWLTDFSSIPWANEIDDIAERFRQYRRLMAHWEGILPVRIHAVDYEEAVADLEGVARRLIAACGLEWEPACLEYYRTRRPVLTASLHQVRRPVYRHSVGRWKHYADHLADLLAALPREDEAPGGS
jgi:tetratricopeptide (TPR) repeat protein